MKRALAAVRRSLFARLLLIFLVTAFAFGVLDNVAERVLPYERPYKRLFGQHVSRYAGYLVDELGWPPDPRRGAELAAAAQLDLRIEGPSLSWASHPAFPPLTDLRFDERGHARRWQRGPQHFVRLERNGYTFVLAAPPMERHYARGPGGYFMLFGSLLILLLCYLAVRRLFAPVRQLRDGVQRIGAGELDFRVPVRSRDELGELAAAVNRMAADVEQMLESKRQLLLAISHELRSPITRARLALELIEADDKRALQQDLDEMERIVADLLEGERLSSRHAALQLDACDLGALLGAVVAEFGDTRVQLEPLPTLAPLQLDAARMRVLVRNLIANALTYGGEQPVTVKLQAQERQVCLQVCDRGPGIDPQDVQRVTEPFYRVDPSRQRGSGGIGLGLYLSARIAAAHGGELGIDSRSGAGTCVSVTLPSAR